MLTLKDVPLDTTTISRSLLDIRDKVRSNLLPWNGQFSPQLVHALLQTYAAQGDLVLDPFMGSGTVLVEAARLGCGAFGSEINPAAFHLANLYSFTNSRPEERAASVDAVSRRIAARLPENPATLASHDDASAKAAILDLVRLAKAPHSAILIRAFVILLDFYKPGLSVRIWPTWRRVREAVISLPFSSLQVQAAHCDARHVPLASGSVDAVVTSPPYINVFNYHQQFRASAEALGWNVLQVASSEIGSNRKHRANRFLTVVQYCLDIAAALLEIERVCRTGARAMVVIGRESNVRKTRFFNGDILVRLAANCTGLVPEVRQERLFTNRFGLPIYEEIVHLRRTAKPQGIHHGALQVALDVLLDARRRAPLESHADLEAAIKSIGDVRPSPPYHLSSRTNAHGLPDSPLREVVRHAGKREAAEVRSSDH